MAGRGNFAHSFEGLADHEEETFAELGFIFGRRLGMELNFNHERLLEPAVSVQSTGLA